MTNIDSAILEIDKVICGNINKFDDSERGLLSQNILGQLRNFVEYISLKIYSNEKELEITYENISDANTYVSTRGDLRFLTKFHRLLQIATSHYTLDEGNSERLMLKYYEYLLKIKDFLSKNGLEVLSNIDEFPIEVDPGLREYYEKIVEKINSPEPRRSVSSYNDRYYIRKIKPFFVNQQVYYEVTFSVANDSESKFDRIIAFTKLDIASSYAVKFSLVYNSIDVLGKTMPIQIIEEWEISIRPCELDHFADIFGKHTKIQGGTQEYNALMAYLKTTGLNLVEIITFPDTYYETFKDQISKKARTTHFLNVLDESRELVRSNAAGANVLRYLLHRLHNKVLKRQYSYEACTKLSSLRLSYGCIPFDEMPFTTSLINHNPKLAELFECIDASEREHELLTRQIKNNTEINAELYTPKLNITAFQNIDDLIRTHNSKLYYKHGHRALEEYKDHIYIKGYEQDTFHIIERLKTLSSSGIKNYSASVASWLQTATYPIDSEEKKENLKQMFEHSEIAIIYGAAGTGKTTLINHVSNFFNDYNKLYLANTNPAVDNLKRRINASNSTHKTIAKFLSRKNENTEYDLLVIDECSTVSNSDMLEVLNKASFKLLLLVGDVYQIEAIRFGNWFSTVRAFIPQTSVFELTNPYRSHNEQLLKLWSKVRNLDEDILEHIARNGYSVVLNESIFERTAEDEIILCLNYDGLYGINNINKFLQGSNPNKAVQWGAQIYKIGDPILFNESERFAPLIYNNLKGKILNISTLTTEIQFDVEIDKTINELDAENYDFQLLDNSETGNSVIRFSVSKLRSTDDDDDLSSNAVVPFQVAYAISIHKAQGLEFSSVKLVITNEIEEMLTHNIFYTAITRAKDALKIYWSPESEAKIMASLKKRDNRKDVALLTAKFKL